MTYDDLYVLIPSHSLEDFPTELGDDEAAGLLNAFAVLWHPLFLAQADTTPSWHRSDEPPETLENRLVIIPSAAEEWLPGGWAGHAEKQGAVVVQGVHDRQEMLDRALAPLDVPAELNADLVGDFIALGTCYLMVELLTIHMHHYSNLDEVEMQRDAVAAANAAVTGDDTAAKAHLTTCFETLLEARERFYPVDCYLLDLCLLIPRLADENLERALASEVPVNLLIGGGDLETMANEKPRMIELMREAWDGERIDIAGGELRERPTPLLPMESVLWDFEKGGEVYRRLLERSPKTWGRRKFGFSTNLPQILNKHGFIAALHIALDDGLYPDAEQAKIRWEGCDGTVVDAITRIPLAAKGAGSYLRFPQRMGESMEEDHVAGVIFARWPEDDAPWFQDLRRIHNYAPVLGRFVTLEDYFESTDDPGRLSTYDAGEYLSPYLIQAVAFQEADPISRYRTHLRQRIQLNDAKFFAATAALLRGEPVDEAYGEHIEKQVETFGYDDGEETQRPIVGELQQFLGDSVKQLADVILHGAGSQPGYLLLNSLAFPRRTVVELPELTSPPKVDGPVHGSQFDEKHKFVAVELPPCGFVWIPLDGGGETSEQTGTPLAEDGIVRNEFFEVWLNEETGGIGRVKGYGRKPNRLSQQLAVRFPEERTWTAGDGHEEEQFTSYYSEMRCRSMTVKSAGPLVGEMETTGDLIDQTNGAKLAGYRQTVRTYRGLPYCDVEMELLDVEHLPEGDPWTNYIGCRWAYNDMAASVTRSVQQGAQGFRGQRFESLHYIEIAVPEERTTICTDGNAFHRKTGNRMIDSLLIATGETNRHFRFRIAVDVDYPMQPALGLMTPPMILPTTAGPPATASAGWFFHLSAKNVQVLSLLDLRPEPVDAGFEDDHIDDEDPAAPIAGSATDSVAPIANPTTDSVARIANPGTEEDAVTDGLTSRSTDTETEANEGFAVRLIETEGRPRRTRLRCFRTPASARQRDFRGRTLNDLQVEADSVIVEMTAYEIADVEVYF